MFDAELFQGVGVDARRGEPRGFGFQHATDVIKLADLPRTARHNDRAVIRFEFDHPDARELAEGLADRCATDTDAQGEFFLDQPVPAAELARENRAEDAFDNPPAAGLGGEVAVEDVSHPAATY